MHTSLIVSELQQELLRRRRAPFLQRFACARKFVLAFKRRFSLKRVDRRRSSARRRRAMTSPMTSLASLSREVTWRRVTSWRESGNRKQERWAAPSYQCVDIQRGGSYCLTRRHAPDNARVAIVIPPPIGQQSIVMSVSVCLCVFVCPWPCVRYYTSDLYQLLWMLSCDISCWWAVTCLMTGHHVTAERLSYRVGQ